jgi:integrase
MRDAVDFDGVASGPSAPARVASTSRVERPLTNPAMTSDSRVRSRSRARRDAPKSDFVFSSPQEKSSATATFDDVLGPSCDPLRPRTITPHALRHTCVALMIAVGANPLMVQRQLGHADLRMTLGTYGHLVPHRDDEVADRMQRLWQRTNPSRPAAYSRPEHNELESRFARHGL